LHFVIAEGKLRSVHAPTPAEKSYTPLYSVSKTTHKNIL